MIMQSVKVRLYDFYFYFYLFMDILISNVNFFLIRMYILPTTKL
jgi:hypothetical protein